MLHDAQTKRNFLLWIDHSSLMNHGHLLMTLNVIYDDALFLSKEEAKIDVQQIVEAPDIYIFGRSR